MNPVCDNCARAMVGAHPEVLGRLAVWVVRRQHDFCAYLCTHFKCANCQKSVLANFFDEPLVVGLTQSIVLDKLNEVERPLEVYVAPKEED